MFIRGIPVIFWRRSASKAAVSNIFIWASTRFFGRSIQSEPVWFLKRCIKSTIPAPAAENVPRIVRRGVLRKALPTGLPRSIACAAGFALSFAQARRLLSDKDPRRKALLPRVSNILGRGAGSYFYALGIKFAAGVLYGSALA